MSFMEFLSSYGLLILSVIATIFSFIISWIIAKRNGNTKAILGIVEKIPSLVITAESLFGKGQGSAKLDYVLTQLRLCALQQNVRIDVEDLTAQINSVVEATKNVNVTPSVEVASSAQSGASVESGTTNTQTNINL